MQRNSEMGPVILLCSLDFCHKPLKEIFRKTVFFFVSAAPSTAWPCVLVHFCVCNRVTVPMCAFACVRVRACACVCVCALWRACVCACTRACAQLPRGTSKNQHTLSICLSSHFDFAYILILANQGRRKRSLRVEDKPHGCGVESLESGGSGSGCRNALNAALYSLCIHISPLTRDNVVHIPKIAIGSHHGLLSSVGRAWS